ncbi:MAG TPA: S8 family serine peptidase, partial [Pilimelia sp.]|nr:S8 family serine peptidase [Pilimelia sp.]
DVDYARTVPGGAGRHVRVLDIEGGWVRDHEDLTTLVPAEVLVPQGVPAFGDYDHGTATIGTLIGDANAAGVTGLVPEATPRLTNDTMAGGKVNRAGAITTAAAALRPGDVMLLEMQMYGCGGGFAPVEWEPAVYDAIRAATATGIIVVEPAGNGNQNLDAPCNGKPFPRGKPDSGAIIVGAGGAGPAQGCSAARRKLGFSTYGTRVDLQGWGECVVTTGYGDLQQGSTRQEYTARFSGTSSATPIVAGAAAALSSIARERGRTLTPAQVRDLLVRTGSPQAGGGKIGPLPNLRAAVAALDGAGPAGLGATARR